MKAIDPGHEYELAHLDGTGTSRLVFVKREGDGYPGNVGHHEGTNLQEVIRALIDRVKYLDRQIHDNRNDMVIEDLRTALWRLEDRARARRGRQMSASRYDIETMQTCSICGHIACEKHS